MLNVPEQVLLEEPGAVDEGVSLGVSSGAEGRASRADDCHPFEPKRPHWTGSR